MSYIYDSSLDIDLYQARMLIGFYKSGMADVQGTMEAFLRELPAVRKFMVVCGTERILEYIKELKFTEKTISVMEKAFQDEIVFDEELKKYLLELDFAKQLHVRSMMDGDVFFAQEPVISVSGPVGMVQYIEKKLLSILNNDVRIASKAARIFLAAGGRNVAEFGGRRHGDFMTAEAARAAYIGGFSSSSSLLALDKYGIPCTGTMGHVWVMAHLDDKDGDGESRAYREWGKHFKNSTYLPDTYNVYDGVEKVLQECRHNIGAIRFDSGDILNISINVKNMLIRRDEINITLGATNNLNEYKIKELLDAGAPLDWFGVGTEVVCTPDAPTCDMIYKLVKTDDKARGSALVAKLADGGGKATFPGAKQVFRHFDQFLELFTHDVLGLADDEINNRFSPRLVNRPVQDWTPEGWNAEKARNYFLEVVKKLPPYLKLIENNLSFPIVRSENLQNAIQKFKSDRTRIKK